jgi:hypothetical protein
VVFKNIAIQFLELREFVLLEELVHTLLRVQNLIHNAQVQICTVFAIKNKVACVKMTLSSAPMTQSVLLETKFATNMNVS